jgi:hypothetical protein
MYIDSMPSAKPPKTCKIGTSFSKRMDHRVKPGDDDLAVGLELGV